VIAARTVARLTPSDVANSGSVGIARSGGERVVGNPAAEGIHGLACRAPLWERQRKFHRQDKASPAPLAASVTADINTHLNTNGLVRSAQTIYNVLEVVWALRL
jgi:hypothetical protein